MIEWLIRIGCAIAGVITGCGLAIYIMSRRIPW